MLQDKLNVYVARIAAMLQNKLHVYVARIAAMLQNKLHVYVARNAAMLQDKLHVYVARIASNVAKQVACLCCSYCSNVARQVACFLLPDLPYLYTFEKRKEKLRPAHQQTRHPSEKYSHKNALLSALSALRFVIIKIRSKETLIESCTS